MVFINNYNGHANALELKNVVERSMQHNHSPGEGYPTVSTIDCLLISALNGGTAEVEKNQNLRVLDGAYGNKSEASRLLRIARKTLELNLKATKKEL